MFDTKLGLIIAMLHGLSKATAQNTSRWNCSVTCQGCLFPDSGGHFYCWAEGVVAETCGSHEGLWCPGGECEGISTTCAGCMRDCDPFGTSCGEWYSCWNYVSDVPGAIVGACISGGGQVCSGHGTSTTKAGKPTAPNTNIPDMSQCSDIEEDCCEGEPKTCHFGFVAVPDVSCQHNPRGCPKEWCYACYRLPSVLRVAVWPYGGAVIRFSPEQTLDDQLIAPRVLREYSAHLGMQVVYLPSFTDWVFASSFAIGAVDIFLASQDHFSFWHDRGYEFTPPFFTESLGALIRKKKSDPHYFLFLEPFAGLWVSLAFCLLLTVVSMVIVHILAPPSGRWGRVTLGYVARVFYHICAAFLGGEDFEWTTPSAKVMRLAVLFFVFIIAATYTADLAAFLVQPEITRIGPTSVEELRESDVCVVAMQGVTSYGCGSRCELHHVVRPFAKKVVMDTFDSCLARLKNGTVQAIVDHVSELHNFQSQHCDSLTLAHSINLKPRSWGFGFRRSHAPAIATALHTANQKLLPSPTYSSIIRSATGLGRTCKDADVDQDHGLTVQHMKGFFVVFGVLVGLAISSACVEACVRRIRSSERLKADPDDMAGLTDAEMIIKLRKSLSVIQMTERMDARMIDEMRKSLNAIQSTMTEGSCKLGSPRQDFRPWSASITEFPRLLHNELFPNEKLDKDVTEKAWIEDECNHVERIAL